MTDATTINITVRGGDSASGPRRAQAADPAAVIWSPHRFHLKGGPVEAYVAGLGDSYASPSGLATTTVYPSGSRSQISRWPGPLP